MSRQATQEKAPRPRGRPPVYLDDADRQAAFRERRDQELAQGRMALAMVKRPTPAFVERVVRAYLDQAADPAAARAQVEAMLSAASRRD